MTIRLFAIAAIAGTALLGAAPLLAQTAAPTRSVWDGVYTAAQADHGKTIFMSTCSRCHGTQLQGADVAPALVGPSFMGDWGGQTVGDLVDRIHTTMPADNPGHLSLATSTDLVAFILQSNQIPAGTNELPHNAQLQQMIRIDANKPAGK